MSAFTSEPDETPARGRCASLYEDVLERMTDQAVRWRSMAVLFFAGGLLADLSTLLPTNDGAVVWALLALGTSAMVSALVMFLFAIRLPDWLMSYVLTFGTLLVTFGVVATRDTAAVTRSSTSGSASRPSSSCRGATRSRTWRSSPSRTRSRCRSRAETLRTRPRDG